VINLKDIDEITAASGNYFITFNSLFVISSVGVESIISIDFTEIMQCIELLYFVWFCT
jgi:hypothetical protein